MLGAVVASMWMVSKNQQRIDELVLEYERKSGMIDGYLKSVPSPTKANLEELEANYAELYSVFQKASSALNLNTYDPDLFFGQSPPTRTDAFFEIARYAQEMRNLSENNGIVFDSETRFGFEEYVNVGPEPDRIEVVHKQVKIMNILLRSLLDSGISEFVAIQREPYEKSGPSPRFTEYRSGPFLTDFQSCVPDAEVFESQGFRLVFKGQSISLRNFLNRIVNSTLPFSINTVEVELIDEEGQKMDRSAIIDNPFFNTELDSSLIEAAQVPIISENESLFVVTVEFISSAQEFEPPLGVAQRKEGGDVEI